MNVLIFGGLGVLGEQLLRLADGHNVVIIDTADPNYAETCKEYGGSKHINSYSSIIQSGKKWDIIYYLAEEASLRFSNNNQTTNACLSNIIQLEDCLSSATILGIPIVVPVWQAYSICDTIGLTLLMKSEITHRFLRRNGSRTIMVTMPTLIDCDYPHSKRGAILSRMINSNESVIIYEEDFHDENINGSLESRSKYLNKTRYWLTVEKAAQQLWDIRKQLMPSVITLDGAKGNLVEVLHAFMAIMDVKELIVNFQKYEPILIERMGEDGEEIATLRDLLSNSFR